MDLTTATMKRLLLTAVLCMHAAAVWAYYYSFFIRKWLISDHVVSFVKALVS